MLLHEKNGNHKRAAIRVKTNDVIVISTVRFVGRIVFEQTSGELVTSVERQKFNNESNERYVSRK